MRDEANAELRCGNPVTAALAAGYTSAPAKLRTGGTLGAVGASPLMICLKKLNICGPVVGSFVDVIECSDFTVRGFVHHSITKGASHELDRLCHEWRDGKLIRRAVLKVGA